MSLNNKNLKHYFYIITTSIVLISCSGNSKNSNQTNNSWLDESDKIIEIQFDKNFSDGYRWLDKSEYWEVSKDMLSKTHKLLEKTPSLEVSENFALTHTGGKYVRNTETKPYLVRAVYGDHKGSFALRWNSMGKILIVTNLTMGDYTQENKYSLIINLKDEPKSVYVAIQSAN